jgi:plastocyanin
MLPPMLNLTSARTFIIVSLMAFSLAAMASLACSDDGADESEVEGETPTIAVGSPQPQETVEVSYAEPGPTTFSVIGGRNEGPIDIEQFLPTDIHIRVGDTIEWTSAGYEGHTITFAPFDYFAELGDYLVPDPDDPEQMIFNDLVALRSGTGESYPGDGGAYNSGFIGVPTEAKYKLTFTEEGIYQYLCVVHPLWMRGTVTVDSADAQVESPESVAARAAAEYDALVADAEALRSRMQEVRRSIPAPGGATLHRVQVGLTTMYGQIAVFIDADLDINAGDTVIFENDDRNFHNVVFKGDLPEFPLAYEVRVDPEGRGINVALAKESAMQVDPPAEGFDETTFLSSGTMGILQPRQTWRLTFDEPGTYVYNCTIHSFAGMAGVITVR